LYSSTLCLLGTQIGDHASLPGRAAASATPEFTSYAAARREGGCVVASRPFQFRVATHSGIWAKEETSCGTASSDALRIITKIGAKRVAQVSRESADSPLLTRGDEMHPIIERSFGGLNRAYYIRNFLFGLIFPAMIYFIFAHGKSSAPVGIVAFVVCFSILNTFLYPYSRFVYESVVDYIVGRNVFIVNAIMMLFVKVMTMFICWYLAILIAPVGLAYLLFRNRTGTAA
jgi:hypothetical protein